MSPILSLNSAVDIAISSLRASLNHFFSSIRIVHRRCKDFLDSSFVYLFDPGHPTGYVFEPHEPRRHTDGPLSFPWSFDAGALSSTSLVVTYAGWNISQGLSLNWDDGNRDDPGASDVGSMDVPVNDTDFSYSLEIDGLRPGTTYAIWFSGMYFDNWEPVYQSTDPISATTLGFDTPPLVSAATDASQGVILSFAPVDGAVSYDVYRVPFDGIHFESPTVTHVSADSLNYTNGGLLAQYSDSTGLDGINYSYSLVANDAQGDHTQASDPAATPAFHTPNIVMGSDSQPINQPYSYNSNGVSVSGTITGTSSYSYTLQYTDTRAAFKGHVVINSSYTGSGTFSNPLAETTINGTTGESGSDNQVLNFVLDATRANVSSSWVIESGIGSGNEFSADYFNYSGVSPVFAQNSPTSSMNITLGQNGTSQGYSQNSYTISLDPNSGNWNLTSGSGIASFNSNDGFGSAATGTYTGTTTACTLGGQISAGATIMNSLRASFSSLVVDGAWQTAGTANTTRSTSESAYTTFSGSISAPGIFNSTLVGSLAGYDSSSSSSDSRLTQILDTSGNWTPIMSSAIGSSSFSERSQGMFSAHSDFSYEPIPQELGTGLVTGTDDQSGQEDWSSSSTNANSMDNEGNWVTLGNASTHDSGFSDDVVKATGSYERFGEPGDITVAGGGIYIYSTTHTPFDFSTLTTLHADGTTTTTGSGTTSNPTANIYKTGDGAGGAGANSAAAAAAAAQSDDDFFGGSGVATSFVEHTGAEPTSTTDEQTTWAIDPSNGHWYKASVIDVSAGHLAGDYTYRFRGGRANGQPLELADVDNQKVHEEWDYQYNRTVTTTTAPSGISTTTVSGSGSGSASGTRWMDLSGWWFDGIHINTDESYSFYCGLLNGDLLAPLNPNNHQVGQQTNSDGTGGAYDVNVAGSGFAWDTFDVALTERTLSGGGPATTTFGLGDNETPKLELDTLFRAAGDWNHTSPGWSWNNQCYEQAKALRNYLKNKYNPKFWTLQVVGGSSPNGFNHNVLGLIPTNGNPLAAQFFDAFKRFDPDPPVKWGPLKDFRAQYPGPVGQ